MNSCECGCGLKTNNRFISGHNSRSKSHRGLKAGKTINSQGYPLIYQPQHPKASKWGYVKEHICIAEKALGKRLPDKAVVHHHNPVQLVICQDQAYHMIIHRRRRALEACGNANYRKCPFCQKWDDPQNMCMTPNKKGAFHKSCRNERLRAKHSKRDNRRIMTLCLNLNL